MNWYWKFDNKIGENRYGPLKFREYDIFIFSKSTYSQTDESWASDGRVFLFLSLDPPCHAMTRVCYQTLVLFFAVETVPTVAQNHHSKLLLYSKKLRQRTTRTLRAQRKLRRLRAKIQQLQALQMKRPQRASQLSTNQYRTRQQNR